MVGHDASIALGDIFCIVDDEIATLYPGVSVEVVLILAHANVNASVNAFETQEPAKGHGPSQALHRQRAPPSYGA